MTNMAIISVLNTTSSGTTSRPTSVGPRKKANAHDVPTEGVKEGPIMVAKTTFHSAVTSAGTGAPCVLGVTDTAT